MTEQKPFRVEVEIAAPREVVWRALTTPERIREWFGWDYEGIEGEIRLIFVDDATHVAPDRIELAEGQHIEVVAAGDRTIVRAVMAGDLTGTDWDDIYDGMEEGWRTFFEQLRFWLERPPTARRRTVYLSGTASLPQVVAAVTEAGVAELWHDSRYQRMVVDRDNHLVSVASGQVPLDRPDEGPVALTVSTYGLDDAPFAELRERWALRWRGLAKDVEVTTG